MCTNLLYAEVDGEPGWCHLCNAPDSPCLAVVPAPSKVYTGLIIPVASLFLWILQKKSLWRRHRLHLVTTSQAFKRTDALKSAQQTLEEGDGMVLSPSEVQTTQQEVIIPTRSQQQAATLATLSKKVEAEPKKGKALSPSELVAQGLAAAAAAAAHAAAPFASFGNAVPFRAVTSRMQNAAAAGQSTAVATIATVTAAVSSNFNKEHSKAPKESQAADPTQWFVCDDPVSHTRYFVIQGSETIDHWRVNLSFDPVVFEDKSLGVKVVLPAPFLQREHHYLTICLLSESTHAAAYSVLHL